MHCAYNFAKNFQDGTFKWPGKDTITIELEDGTPPFTMPRQDLAEESRYFDVLLNGPFRESQTRTLHFAGDDDLPACDGNTFKLFLYWAYKYKLPDPKSVYAYDQEWLYGELFSEAWLKTENPEEDIYEPMIMLWWFADRYLIPELQRDVMRYLLMVGINPGVRIKSMYVDMNDIADGITPDLTALIFAITPNERSPLRVWIVRMWAWKLFERGEIDMDDTDCNTLSAIEGFWWLFNYVQMPRYDEKTQSPSEDKSWDEFGLDRKEIESCN